MKQIYGYKGFDKELKCNGFQYEVGKEYQCEKAVAFEEGFHFCERPLSVLTYCPPCGNDGTLNRFFTVKGGGEFDNRPDITYCTRLKVYGEIGLDYLIQKAVDNILTHVETSETDVLSDDYTVASKTLYRSSVTNNGYYSISAHTGACSAVKSTKMSSISVNTGCNSLSECEGGCSVSANTGNCSVATNEGNCSLAGNTGDSSAAVSKGDFSAAVSLNGHSVATNTGNFSVAACAGYKSESVAKGKSSISVNTGNNSMASNTGIDSVASNVGYGSFTSVEGKESIALAAGKECMAKGSLGCWIVLTERGEWDGESYPINEVKAFKVDGEAIKPDTYYKLVNGKAVEA